MLDDAIRTYYDLGLEQERLASSGEGTLEWARTLDVLERFLPAAPANVTGGWVGRVRGARAPRISLERLITRAETE